MTAPAASDLARAVEALRGRINAANGKWSTPLTEAQANTLLAALRSREQEIARWKAVADELAGAMRRAEYAGGEYGGECPVCSFEKDWPERHDPEGCELSEALARYDAAVKEGGDA